MYCTVTDVKDKLNITGTTYDSAITSYCQAASAWVDEYCGYPSGAFAMASNTTRYYQASDIDCGVLNLDMPLLTVSSITNGDGTAVTGSMYRLYPRNFERKYQIGMLTSYAWLFDTDGEITVTGKFGYSTTVPTPVVEATTQLAGWIFKRYQAALQDSTANLDLGQLTYNKAIPEQVKALLEPYKRLV